MKTDFRNRAFLPVVLPLLILLVIAAAIGVVAAILLFVDREGAVAIALLAAAGILVAVALAASRDRLSFQQKGAVSLAIVAPLAIGALAAAGVVGNIADEDRNWNAQPHAPQFVFDGILEGAPVLAATNSLEFCIPTAGGCEGTRDWTLPVAEDEPVTYAFDNREAGVAHNLWIFDVGEDVLASLGDTPIGLGELLDNHRRITPADPPNIDGGVAQTYQWTVDEEAGDEPLPGQGYFVCTLHAGSMWGVVDIVTGG